MIAMTTSAYRLWGVMSIILCVVILASFPFGELHRTLTLIEYGKQVYPGEHLVFYNWRQACHYVQQHFQEGDLLFATMLLTTEYYLGRPSLYLNAASLDGTTREYNFSEMLQTNNRGWIVMDLRSNQRVDASVIDMISRDMIFHSDASDQSVQVYGWDAAIPLAPERPLFELNEKRILLRPYHLTVSERTIRPIPFEVEIEGVDSPIEAFMLLNDRGVKLPMNRAEGRRDRVQVTIPAGFFVHGENVVTFHYRPDERERYRGYKVYDFRFLDHQIH
jgi:hypothetical protein